MRLHLSSLTRRTIGVAFATTLVAAGLTGSASAASPAGDAGQVRFSFRDDPGMAVMAVYPYSDGETSIGYLRVKGPRAGWLDNHPLPKGTVGWRVVVRTAPTKSGPWTIQRVTTERSLLVDKTGAMEWFKSRSVPFEESDKKLFVRVSSRLEGRARARSSYWTG